MNKLLSTNPVMATGGFTIIRVIIGCFLIYHGWEVFHKSKMDEYSAWDVFKKSSSPALMAYLGKSAELVAGILLALGLFTRVSAVIIIGTFIYIPFFVGSGKIWYEDQYPFLFALFGFVFFFAGPGSWSLDHLLFDKNKIVKNQ
ncbi:MAG: DoxX family protein [Ginsengibacter sp.]